MNNLPTVLLVDSNAELREATGDLLAALGCKVIAAPRAEEALRVLESGAEGVDLIVADVPQVAGGTAEIRELCSRGGERGVVLMSSAAEEPALRRALAAERPRFVRKPFSARDLGRAVEQALAAGPRRSLPAGREAEVVPPARKRPVGAWVVPAWAVAAAGLAIVGTGFWLWTVEPALPPLPEPVAATARRGASVELDAPRGEIRELPAELRFQEVAGAGSYKVRILGVDERVLWESEAAAAPVALPLEVRASLHEGVVYYWRVEALDAEGEVMARSRPVKFRVTPGRAGGAIVEKVPERRKVVRHEA